MNSSVYGRFTAWLKLEAESINIKLMLIFLASNLLLVDGVNRFVSNIKGSDYLIRLAESPSMALMNTSLEDGIKPIQLFFDNHHLEVILIAFVTYFFYQLFVISVVTSIVRAIARHRGIVFHKMQVFNALLLVYSFKTFADVVLVGYVIDWLVYGLNTMGSVIASLFVNVLTYCWLYIILRDIYHYAPSEVDKPKLI